MDKNVTSCKQYFFVLQLYIACSRIVIGAAAMDDWVQQIKVRYTVRMLLLEFIH